MPKISEMNDWSEYRERLQNEIDRQATSNKALLWVGVAINGVANIIAITLAIVALVNAMMLNRDNMSLQKEIASCKEELKESIQSVEITAIRAKRAYDNARQRDSRSKRATTVEDDANSED